MKTLHIMRGLPGSGKTHHAHCILATIHTKKFGTAICSADHFMLDNRGGYKFDPSKLGEAHAKCQISVMNGMLSDVDCIILDNTNTKNWEYMVYEKLAAIYGYEVEIHDLYDGGLTDEELEKRNQHGVPREKICQMRHGYEC